MRAAIAKALKYLGQATRINPSNMKKIGKFEMYDTTGLWKPTIKPSIASRIASRVVSKLTGKFDSNQVAGAAGRSGETVTNLKVPKSFSSGQKEKTNINPMIQPGKMQQHIKRVISKWKKM